MPRATYIDTNNKQMCTGCAACAHVCPTKAIEMREDPYGFDYPVVDEDRCVGCGKCFRTCHMVRPDDLKAPLEPKAYGAYVRDRSSLMRSASGGVATAIALDIVSRGGVAYGCVAHREVVRHERLATEADVDCARGSKYVQSDVSGVYSQIASDLRENVDVVFIGTPCQCAALRSVFGGDEHLLLIDLVCEGVPSRRMYADFLNSLEEKRGRRVLDFRFRDKRRGWSTKNATVVSGNDNPPGKQPHSYSYYYYWLFAHALILRDSCYACPYACPHRVGDISIGDFWGVETAGVGYDIRQMRDGISCVLVNTDKGGRTLVELGGSLDLRNAPFETVARANSCLRFSSSCDVGERTAVLSSYGKRGAEGMEDEYQRLFSGTERVREMVSSRTPLVLRVVAKKVQARMRRA